MRPPLSDDAPRAGLALRATLIFLGCGLAAFCFTPSDKWERPRPVVTTPAGTSNALAISEEVQRLLAQGGCPGWIAVANEPKMLEGSVRPAAHEESQPRLVQLPSPADDDLISEEEDLLSSSPEITGAQSQPGEDAAPAAETPAKGDQQRREYSPQELLRDKPQSTGPADAKEDDLLDGEEDLVAPPTELPPPRADDELLKDNRDLLAPPAPPAAPQGSPAKANSQPPGLQTTPNGGRPGAVNSQTPCHFVADSLYPSATACRACHEKIYEEWSVSSHAYAAVSPMFHKFEQKINDLTQGTIGYFCYRCHLPVGTALGLSRAAPLWDAPLVAREGVTCVACHRVQEMYGKTNGERRIEPGDIYAPVFGSIGGDGVAIAAAQKDNFKIKTSPHDKGPGQPMHAAAFCMPQLSRSEFCMSCHQVAVYPGIKLEVVWEQYRASPACKKGISCQDCHMGRIPGVPSGYDFGPAAEINKKFVNANRKHANHIFYGPGYSIAHPGVFPFNPKAERWSMRDWLLFDWRAGWGTEAFEDAVADGVIQVAFPDVWKEADDRSDAREIIEDNLKKKTGKYDFRAQVMENGSRVDGPFFDKPRACGQDLEFSYLVANTNEGHNLPTASLGAQPQLWANVALIGPAGERVWESGYLDANGDLADIHSEHVRTKQIADDWQLFNLQTMFLITGAKGADREFFLPVNIDVDPLPFIRPAPQPVSVINHPPFIRMEARSLAPLGMRRVPYRVPGRLIREPGRYRLSFRLRSRTEPLYFMRFVGATPEMQRGMIEGTLDFHQSSVEFDVR
jgi:hypothetical protein